MKILKDLGLKVTIETKTSKKQDGEVLEQSKSEGTVLKAGDSVTITVSKKSSGTNENEVPENVIEPEEPEKENTEVNNEA